MDANGTRYHLLRGQHDWAICSTTMPDRRQSLLRDLWEADTPGTPLMWNPERDDLTLAPRLFQFVAAPLDKAPTQDQRRGAARDRYGNWYWIAEDERELLVNSSGSETTAHFWASDDVDAEDQHPGGDFQPVLPPAPPTRRRFSGLTVTSDHFLVAGILDPVGLVIFDLFTGGPPQEIVWRLPFAPYDMAAAPDGGLWILDRNRLLWALDRTFALMSDPATHITLDAATVDMFQPQHGGTIRAQAARTFPAGIAIPPEILEPIAIEALPDGTLLVLDNGNDAEFALIHHLRFGQRLGAPLSTKRMQQLMDPDSAATFRLPAHDFAFVPTGNREKGDPIIGQVYVASTAGNQSFAFNLCANGDTVDLEPLAQYFPMRLFGGRALVAASGRVSYDCADRWVPLVEQHRPRYVSEGTFYTPIARDGFVLDGRAPDCVWHRLMVDACIPPGTMVHVRSRSANRLEDVPNLAWTAEPPLTYRRSTGTELPFIPANAYDTWELLFQKAQGRYLQLEIQLEGNGQTTPRLRALRAYYPRFSYLEHYLPAVYREDRVSASFLSRFLANVEGVYTAIEDRIAAAQVLFDPRSAPPDALAWLASWFGVALDSGWDEARCRLFIAHAMALFGLRGTSRGLRMALELVLSECPDTRIFTDSAHVRERMSGIRIVERFRTRRTPAVVLGDPTNGGIPASPRGSERWTPAQGSTALQQQYAAFRQQRGLEAILPEDYSLTPPDDGAAEWEAFSYDQLGFLPLTGASGQWRAFLMRRYPTVNQLNAAHGLTDSLRYPDYEAVNLPLALPTNRAALDDWYQFHAYVLAAARLAHQFTVLLPAPLTGEFNEARQRERLELVNRVIALEKPSHTTFTVRFYWSMFRVGEVRLGYDTVVGHGHRAPGLMTPLLLGETHIGESYLMAAAGVPSGRHYLAGDVE